MSYASDKAKAISQILEGYGFDVTEPREAQTTNSVYFTVGWHGKWFNQVRVSDHFTGSRPTNISVNKSIRKTDVIPKLVAYLIEEVSKMPEPYDPKKQGERRKQENAADREKFDRAYRVAHRASLDAIKAHDEELEEKRKLEEEEAKKKKKDGKPDKKEGAFLDIL